MISAFSKSGSLRPLSTPIPFWSWCFLSFPAWLVGRMATVIPIRLKWILHPSQIHAVAAFFGGLGFVESGAAFVA